MCGEGFVRAKVRENVMDVIDVVVDVMDVKSHGLPIIFRRSIAGTNEPLEVFCFRALDASELAN